jgi:hypothetical protein
MGLIEQIQSGAAFTRNTVTLPIGSGSSTAFGNSYILLDVTSTGQSRVRLYSDSASVAIDSPRSTASFDYSASVGLNLDTYLDGASKLTFDPPIIATTFSASTTFYNVSGSGVIITYYPIESQYATRQQLTFYATSLVTGSYAYGNVTSPKSFIILSASCNTSQSRLRLYSRDINLVPPSELARSFGTALSDGSYLIADMVFDSASYAYKVSPVLQAYNLTTYTEGSNFVGYRIDNISTTSSIANVTASLYIYSVED